MSILKHPIVTEKMTSKADLKNKQYGFVVDKNANKIQIRKEIEKMYGVTVEGISTLIVYGKKKKSFYKSTLYYGSVP